MMVEIPIEDIKFPTEYKNPRSHNESQTNLLSSCIDEFGVLQPLILNSCSERFNFLIGGFFRYEVLKNLGYKIIPVIYTNIPDVEKEKILNIKLNKATGEFDLKLLAVYDDNFLANLNFSSEERDKIFQIEETPEMFDLQKELRKMDINSIEAKHGDIYVFEKGGVEVGRLMNGDSTIEADMFKLMEDEKADMCMTDPPYILDYLRGKSKNKDGVTRGFGSKKNRVYLGTETLPENFSDLWMANIAKIQKEDFSIIIFEHPKNLRTIWNALETHWRYRNTITWHVPNRMQGFSGKYKFFNKKDIALVGSIGNIGLNLDLEDDPLFQHEYENALYATSGKPHWESYEKGKKICPTDFISHTAADKKSSGQEIVFGTKPLELLIPYIKVLTKRGNLVVEPFGGSGSTAVAAIKLGRRFRMMEKSSVYTEVIRKRLEKLLGVKAKKYEKS